MGRRHRLLLSGLAGGYLASLAPSWRRFVRGLRDPARAQREVLQSVLRAAADSDQAEAFGLGRIRNLRDLQDRVPIRTYDDYAPQIERIAAGRPRVLTGAPVRMFERSSGSSGGTKLVPYTQGLLDDFSAATGPWLFGMYSSRPALLGTKSYWSVSPAARDRDRTLGGIDVGFEDDTEYFDPVSRWALGQMMAVPGTLAREQDVDRWRRRTLDALLRCEDLGFVSVWSPTFLTGLMRALERDLEARLDDLPPARAGAIRQGLDRAGALTARALWPRLGLLSAWADGHAARFVGPMQAYFPDVELEAKGLLATEGVFSIPWPQPGAPRPVGQVAAITSHVLELVDLQAPQARPLPVYEARIGGRYAPLMSTRGGLLRYKLQDEVECIGFVQGTPTFRFVGKLDKTSDLCGEKLTASEVERVLQRAADQTAEVPRFCMLAPAPDATPPRYTLFVEGATRAEAFAAAVESALLDNFHYRYARDIGQLGAVAAVEVERGADRYEAALRARGVRAGDIKPTSLDPGLQWPEVFGAVSSAD